MKQYMLTGFSFICFFVTYTQNVPNDSCHQATPVLLSTQCNLVHIDFTDATASYACTQCNSGCILGNPKDLWYALNIPSNTQLVMEKPASEIIDVEIFSGDCENLVSTTCISSFGGDVTVLDEVPPGDYLLRISQVVNDDFDLCFLLCSPPQIDSIEDGCVPYTLPEITGANLTGNEKYYDQPGGQGASFEAGKVFEAAIPLYAYDIHNLCESEQPISILNIDNHVPNIFNLGNWTNTEMWNLETIPHQCSHVSINYHTTFGDSVFVDTQGICKRWKLS